MNDQNDCNEQPFIMTNSERDLILKFRELCKEEQEEFYRAVIDSALRNLQK